MRLDILNPRPTGIGLALVLLLAGAASSAQQTINLSADPATATLPDGTTVSMWSYHCGVPVSPEVSCRALNPQVPAGGWSPVVITVPSGQTLQINLTNNLSFATGGNPATNNIPTSLTIVGQLGAGLGTSSTAVASPQHSSQVVTWATVGSANLFTPPPQASRVQSFSTEVAAGVPPVSLTWQAPRPGTYLLESGTHPSIQGPMGLYGMVVVTDAAHGCAYPGANNAGCNANAAYNADVDLLLSEIDPVMNSAVQAAIATAGFSETATFNLRESISGITASPPGLNYAIGDIVTLSGGGGTATAAVTSVDASGAITGITVTPGQAYTGTPIATVASATGTGAVLTVSMAVNPNTLSTCSGNATPLIR